MAMLDTSNRERRLTGVARGMRAAIVLPVLFALALLVIREPAMAGFAVFGTFAHLVIVNYSKERAARSAECVALTLLGAVMVIAGTFASEQPWLAVAGAVAAGFLAEWPALASQHLVVIRPALLMAFMLAVAIPTPLRSLPPELCGWLLAGAIAQPALQLLWIPIGPVALSGKFRRSRNDDVSASLGSAFCAGAAMGFAVLIARLLGLNHAFWVVLGVAPLLSMRNDISAASTFWHQQAGTLLGFLFGAVVVSGIGAHQMWSWIALPCVVFVAAYLWSAVGFGASQAGFSAFSVVLFCILTPLQRDVGIVRIEDIFIGGTISLLAAALRHLWQRGNCHA